MLRRLMCTKLLRCIQYLIGNSRRFAADILTTTAAATTNGMT